MAQIGVFATVLDALGRVVLCHRADADFWGQPGGGMDPGESPWAGVAREVREETGLTCEVVRLAGVYSRPEDDAIVFSFVCHVITGELTPSDESPQVAYFPPDALPANLFLGHAERIRDALAPGGDVVLRVPTVISATEQMRVGKGAQS